MCCSELTMVSWDRSNEWSWKEVSVDGTGQYRTAQMTITASLTFYVNITLSFTSTWKYLTIILPSESLYSLPFFFSSPDLFNSTLYCLGLGPPSAEYLDCFSLWYSVLACFGFSWLDSVRVDNSLLALSIWPPLSSSSWIDLAQLASAHLLPASPQPCRSRVHVTGKS